VQRVRFAMNAVVDDTRAARRAEGYAATMEAAGLQPEIVRSGETDDIRAGSEHIRRLAQEPAARRPRAVVFATDSMAMAALLGSSAVGLAVPTDCAVAGFGDAPIGAILTPALTTVRTAPYAIGCTAARTLIELLHSPADSVGLIQTHHIPCELVVRDSSRVSGF
jgi:LacI family gluconate utilization system Gnt-I transcriptional repressor